MLLLLSRPVSIPSPVLFEYFHYGESDTYRRDRTCGDFNVHVCPYVWTAVRHVTQYVPSRPSRITLIKLKLPVII